MTVIPENGEMPRSSTTYTYPLPNFAFTGKAGAGKTTAAEFLELAGYNRLSIAGPLKATAVELLGPGADKNRGFLQDLGQLVRDEDEDAWVRLMLRKLRAAETSRTGYQFAVDDLRFPNEYWKLKEDRFVIVRITAPRSLRIDRLKAIGKLQDEAQLDNISETALDDFEADYTIPNDGVVDDFIDDVKAVVSKEAKRV